MSYSVVGYLYVSLNSSVGEERTDFFGLGCVILFFALL